ncbi:MAG: hypothetical protein RLO17_00710 [Cyclobacteriaceae bacterium]
MGRIAAFLICTFILLAQANAQKAVSLNIGSGIVIWPTQIEVQQESLNYGANLQLYFLNKGFFSIGVQSGFSRIRAKYYIEMSSWDSQYSYSPYDFEKDKPLEFSSKQNSRKSVVSHSIYFPLFINGHFALGAGWFNEISLGGYYSNSIHMINFAAGLGFGYSFKLNDQLSLPIKIRVDDMRLNDPILFSINTGITFKR